MENINCFFMLQITKWNKNVHKIHYPRHSDKILWLIWLKYLPCSRGILWWLFACFIYIQTCQTASGPMKSSDGSVSDYQSKGFGFEPWTKNALCLCFGSIACQVLVVRLSDCCYQTEILLKWHLNCAEGKYLKLLLGYYKVWCCRLRFLQGYGNKKTMFFHWE